MCAPLLLTTNTKVAPSVVPFPLLVPIRTCSTAPHTYARRILLGQIEEELWLLHSCQIHCRRLTLASVRPQDLTAEVVGHPRDRPRSVLASPSFSVRHDSERAHNPTLRPIELRLASALRLCGARLQNTNSWCFRPSVLKRWSTAIRRHRKR